MALTLGPLLIVGVLYWTTLPRWVQGRLVPRATSVPSQLSNSGDYSKATDSSHKTPLQAAPATGAPPSELEAACRHRATELAHSLCEDCQIIVRAPYIVGGNLTEMQLVRHYRETIVPTARALSTMFFDTTPDRPVVILLFSDAKSYRAHAQQLDGRQQANFHGYYVKKNRRVILNLATGNGTLAHELTHMLAHFDFPAMPEWFDEGLASLFEQSEFSADELRLQGISNWRLPHITSVIREDRLPRLEAFVSARRVRPDQQAIDYAYARYFCLYLQRRRLLEPFYRKFRRTVETDPNGLQTLRNLLQVDSLAEVEQDFRNWVLDLSSVQTFGKPSQPVGSRQSSDPARPVPTSTSN
jgi:hypothetical protein